MARRFPVQSASSEDLLPSNPTEDVHYPFLRKQVPKVFHEVGILSGYRMPHCGIRDCIASLIRRNNEAMNFWSNFLPGCYFLFLAFRLLLSDSVGPGHVLYLLFLLGGCSFFLLISSCAHCFNAISPRARHSWFLMDYFALSQHAFVTSLCIATYVLEGFYEHRFVMAYRAVCCVVGVLGLVLTTSTRFLRGSVPRRRLLRSLAFSTPYFATNAPLLHKIYHYRFICVGSDCDAMDSFQLQFLLCTLAILIYGLHLPERLFPYTFDVFGHSHQLFHIIGTLGTYYLNVAIYTAMKSGVGQGEFPWGSVALFAAFSGINGLIVFRLIRGVHVGRLVPVSSTEHIGRDGGAKEGKEGRFGALLAYWRTREALFASHPTSL